MKGIVVTLMIPAIDFSLLKQLAAVQVQVEAALRSTIAQIAGARESVVAVELFPGSVVARITIIENENNAALRMELALESAAVPVHAQVTQHLYTVEGIDEVCTSVNNLQVMSVRIDLVGLDIYLGL